LVSAREHALKLRACKDSTDGELFVIARTEALIAGYSLEEALDRGEAYAEAGADAILIHSKEKTPDQIVEFAGRWTRSTPLVAVPTTYDTITAAISASSGIASSSSRTTGLRAAIRAIETAYARLLPAGRACVLMATTRQHAERLRSRRRQRPGGERTQVPARPRSERPAF